ncbi:hypothetical protein ACWDZ4_20195 [Streptomyces sp. NPDC003016]
MTTSHFTRYAAAAVQTRRSHILLPTPVHTVLAHRLLREPADVRRAQLAKLPYTDLVAVMTAVAEERGAPYALWHDSPSGFAEDVVGVSVWEKRRQVLDAVVTHRQVAAPTCFGGAKTQTAALLVAWAGAVSGYGYEMPVVLSSQMEEVEAVWFHLRAFIDRAGLPGTVGNATAWHQKDEFGHEHNVAFGGVLAHEFALSRMHNPLVVVVGTSHIDGDAGALIETAANGPQRLVVIGTPAPEPGTWFEELCGRADVATVRTAISDLPSATGEPTAVCRDCADTVPTHHEAAHFSGPQTADRLVRRYGAGHPRVQAAVHALHAPAPTP